MVKRGWYGDSSAHASNGKKGGKKTSSLYGETFYQHIGKKGGKVSPGNFKNNPERAKAAGSKGGKAKKKHASW